MKVRPWLDLWTWQRVRAQHRVETKDRRRGISPALTYTEHEWKKHSLTVAATQTWVLVINSELNRFWFQWGPCIRAPVTIGKSIEATHYSFLLSLLSTVWYVRSVVEFYNITSCHHAQSHEQAQIIITQQPDLKDYCNQSVVALPPIRMECPPSHSEASNPSFWRLSHHPAILKTSTGGQIKGVCMCKQKQWQEHYKTPFGRVAWARPSLRKRLGSHSNHAAPVFTRIQEGNCRRTTC